MGLLNLFKFKPTTQIQAQSNAFADENAKPTQVDIEYRLVENVSTADMQQFSHIPYHLYGPIQKSLYPNHHPFAYMDLDQQNQIIARQSLQYIDSFIQSSHSLSKYIPKKFVYQLIKSFITNILSIMVTRGLYARRILQPERSLNTRSHYRLLHA